MAHPAGEAKRHCVGGGGIFLPMLAKSAQAHFAVDGTLQKSSPARFPLADAAKAIFPGLDAHNSCEMAPSLLNFCDQRPTDAWHGLNRKN
jgi:hypothetical protein